MKHHYYFVSSLYDLLLDKDDLPLSMEEFLDFSEEQLDDKEFDHLKRIFIFNDIENWKALPGQPFLTPSYYTQEELQQVKIDPEDAFLFIRKYFETDNSGMLSVDTLMKSFYEELDSFVSCEVKNYFLFELNLRNIATALVLRKKKEPFHDRIIPIGGAAERILNSTSLNFGLSDDFSFIDHLIVLLDEKPIHTIEHKLSSSDLEHGLELTALEKAIDEQRWIWLTENWELELFGILTVFSYAAKLAIVHRWHALDAQKGKQFFNKLLNQIKNSIIFSDELFINTKSTQR